MRPGGVHCQMRLLVLFRRLVLLLLVVAPVTLVACSHFRRAPQDLPWTDLSLSQPIGLFTRAKLVGLAGDAPRCLALLDAAGVRHTSLPPLREGLCGYDDGLRLEGGGAQSIALRPAGAVLSCPVAAALAVWEWQVVQPAALRHFGRPVTGIDHLGSYACRRIYGQQDGNWSEHSTADALDIAGFRLQGGETVAVRRDWADQGPKGAFLREVRQGGCRLFGTVLSPDYNAAHADHLHLDQAARGRFGGLCS